MAAVGAVREAHREERKQTKLQDLTYAFKQFDRDKDGRLDIAELQKGLKEMNFEATTDQIALIVNEFGCGNSKQLTLQQFRKLIDALGEIRELKTSDNENMIDRNPGSILGKYRKLPYQDAVQDFYNNKWIVMLVASVIIANFVVNILEKEIDPDIKHLKYADTWDNLDLAFNIIFIIELLMNMYGYGGPVCKFWASPWNCFDFFIVTVSVVLLMGIFPPDSPASKLKLLRAFRVFRLFKRVKSLNSIIVALLGAIPGTMNAFVIITIFFCIYAILGVELFRDFGNTGAYLTIGDDDTEEANYTVSAITSRGFDNGWEYYGTFNRAMYTLFQVSSGVVSRLSCCLDPWHHVHMSHAMSTRPRLRRL